MELSVSERVQKFKLELADLLEKYELELRLYMHEDSDTYGIYDECVAVSPEEDEEKHYPLTFWGCWTSTPDDLRKSD